MGDMDRFLKESSRSYRECRAKNSARRNSLQKKTLGIEVQRKMAAAQLSREERQLQAQLKGMTIDRTKTAIMASIKDRSGSKSRSKRPAVEADDHDQHGCPPPLDPYPVTFAHHTPVIRARANTLDDGGRAFAARRCRRQSREFEDLHVNTATGSLTLSRLQALAARAPSTPSTHTLSPTSPRRLDSCSSVDSANGEGPWLGDPQAIGSVRRPRKSVEDQEWERLARKEAHLHSCH